MVSGFGGAIMHLKTIFGGGSWDSQVAAANEKEQKEQEGQTQAKRTQAAIGLLPGLVSARESSGIREEQGEHLFDDFGDNKDRYSKLYSAQIRTQQTAAEAPFMRPRELQEQELSDWKQRSEAGAYHNKTQATEAGIQIRERADASLSGTRSNRENLEAGLARGSERWDNAPVSGAFGGAFEASADQQDIARSMGDKLTDYADSITRSGSLAAGADVNTMAGAADGAGRIRHEPIPGQREDGGTAHQDRREHRQDEQG